MYFALLIKTKFKECLLIMFTDIKCNDLGMEWYTDINCNNLGMDVVLF